MSERILTSAQMKRCDAYMIEKVGIPSPVLMERAALAAADALLRGDDPAFDLSEVLCVCGTGNNGGDGVAVARILCLAGVRARVLLVGERARCSADAALQLRIAENCGVELREAASPDAARAALSGGVTTLVDALFGIGLSRPLESPHTDVIAAMNALSARKLALDVPSGVSADTGACMGAAIRADKTVVFAFMKRGLSLAPGRDCAGRIVVRDIGITDRALRADDDPEGA